MEVQCSYCKVFGHSVEVCQAPDHATGLVKPRRSQFYNQPSEWIRQPRLKKGAVANDDENNYEAGPYEVIITGLDKLSQAKVPNQVCPTFLSFHANHFAPPFKHTHELTTMQYNGKDPQPAISVNAHTFLSRN
jgi:hypothetical protein